MIAVHQCSSIIKLRSFDFIARVAVGSTLIADGNSKGVATWAVGASKSANVRMLFSATDRTPLVPKNIFHQHLYTNRIITAHPLEASAITQSPAMMGSPSAQFAMDAVIF